MTDGTSQGLAHRGFPLNRPPVADRFLPMHSRILSARRVLIASHEMPEGDCLGSSLALGLGLEQLGQQVTLYNPDPVPRQCQFMVGHERFQRSIPQGDFDLIYVLDCGDIQRIGSAAQILPQRGPILNIDHHRSNTYFGQMQVVDDLSSSTSELIYWLMTGLPITLTLPMAEAIYAGIITDTNSFQYANTSPWTLEVGRALMDMGVTPAKVATGLFESMSLARIRVLPRVLDTLELSEEGRIASIQVTQPMLQAAGATLTDTEGFINYPRSIDGVEVAVFYREKANGFAVSLRSKYRVDVGAVATALGGGGHRLAASFLVKGTLDQARELLREPLHQALREGFCPPTRQVNVQPLPQEMSSGVAPQSANTIVENGEVKSHA